MERFGLGSYQRRYCRYCKILPLFPAENWSLLKKTRPPSTTPDYGLGGLTISDCILVNGVRWQGCLGYAHITSQKLRSDSNYGRSRFSPLTSKCRDEAEALVSRHNWTWLQDHAPTLRFYRPHQNLNLQELSVSGGFSFSVRGFLTNSNCSLVFMQLQPNKAYFKASNVMLKSGRLHHLQIHDTGLMVTCENVVRVVSR